ncbi:Bifunctional nitrilase/nitrile hydratase NIT4 [Platanthera guangdongensis]|uniref:Bifunctional nitrilase/nitrile hydratase NIT4 n=1 Tax=Platanthera guangdongensis TaxID=2320717 RepID=A0ABR2MS63_9ASPA
MSLGPEVNRLAAIAGKYKVFLVMGVIERAGYTLYCHSSLFDPLGRYLVSTVNSCHRYGARHMGLRRWFHHSRLRNSDWKNRCPHLRGEQDAPLRTALYGKGENFSWCLKHHYQYYNIMTFEILAVFDFPIDAGVEIYCAPTAEAREVWQSS